MKKSLLLIFVLGIVLSGSLLWGKTSSVKCSSSLVTLSFKNVKLKNIKFTDSNDIKFEVNSDSFRVVAKVKGNTVSFISKKKGIRPKILLFLPKDKNYQTYIENKYLCKFDQSKIEAQIDENQKIIIKDGTVKVLDNKDNQVVSIGGEGIYVNDEDQQVRINGNGIYIKSDDEDVKDYQGFWAKLLGKTITGFTGFVMDLSLKDIGKNVAKIINQQNFRVVSGKLGKLEISSSIRSDWYHEEISKNILIKRKTVLTIDNFNGSMILKKSDSDTLKINIVKYAAKEKYLKKIKVKITEEKKFINIKSYKEDQLIEGGVKLIVSCPNKVSLEDLKTENGDITITDCRGKLNAITSNGDISVKNFMGNVGSLTSNGDIYAKNITGKTNLSTSNGKIDGKNISDLTTAKSLNGKINLRNIKLLSDVSSSNSSIYLDAKDILNNTEIKSSNGKITLVIPQNINLSIEAKTSNGSIITSNLAFVSSKSGEGYFKGKLGNGKKKVILRTSNSNILIKRK